MAAVAVSRPVLDERLATARDDVLAAQRALGEVELDGGDRAAAVAVVVAARGTVDALVAAVGAFEERGRSARDERMRRHDVTNTLRVLDWVVKYLQRARVVLELRPLLEEAEAALMVLGGVRACLDSPIDSVTGRGVNHGDWLREHSRDLGPLGGEVPEVAVAEEYTLQTVVRRGQVGRLSVARCDELLAEVAELRAVTAGELDSRGKVGP